MPLFGRNGVYRFAKLNYRNGMDMPGSFCRVVWIGLDGLVGQNSWSFCLVYRNAPFYRRTLSHSGVWGYQFPARRMKLHHSFTLGSIMPTLPVIAGTREFSLVFNLYINRRLFLISRKLASVSILGAPKFSNSPLRPSDRRQGGAHSSHAQEVANQVSSPSPFEQAGSLKQPKSQRCQKSNFKILKGTKG
ncbi:hypothetical protein Nepgr_003894 [Nepenthes gracilis]|uniref:Uncharacterized protein n=1 Tax=Nepenthes gracilis TaxID=150966 RepID=A0AAD3XEI1_NEPGR|nr:hypothetical protein Nepgr_003894 [Nepenthes gracilis]